MTYLAPEGVQAVTESLDEIAVVKVQTTIWNRTQTAPYNGNSGKRWTTGSRTGGSSDSI